MAIPIDSLTEQDKEKIRYHLGYLETSFASSVAFGMPKPIQTIFLLESAMDLLVNGYAVQRARVILCTMDDYEAKLRAAGCTLIAEKLGNMTLRSAKLGETYTDLLEREYIRWGNRLADVLGVTPYPFSAKYGRTPGGYGPVPVR